MHDDPDFHPRVTPGITRWAPGTEFGTIAWDNHVPAVTIQTIIYAFPNNGYLYVIDKIFAWRDTNGVTPISMEVCDDIGTPVWNMVALLEMDQSIELTPFSMVSMVLAYPMAVRWEVNNSCNVAKWLALHATMYRYKLV